MDTSAWIAIAGLALGNGLLLLGAIVKHAKTEERVNGKLKEFERALERGDARFRRIDSKLDGVHACLTGIKVQIATLAAKLGVGGEEREQGGA